MTGGECRPACDHQTALEGPVVDPLRQCRRFLHRTNARRESRIDHNLCFRNRSGYYEMLMVGDMCFAGGGG